jgi:shikimate kinase
MELRLVTDQSLEHSNAQPLERSAARTLSRSNAQPLERSAAQPLSRSVALVGLSGSGKSTVGRLLAERLGWPLRDTDAIIVDTHGRSVAEIFAADGEPRFRELEAAALGVALGSGPCVVATGGGIVLRQENRELLRAHAFVAWLDAPAEALLARLRAHDQARPLLQGDDPLRRLADMRAARSALYADVAHVRVATAPLPAEQVAQLLYQWIDPAIFIGQNWSAIRRSARAYLDSAAGQLFERAAALYGHPAWEVRAFALALLGGQAAGDSQALAFLFERCGEDPAWQANEALAMAFDDYCAAVGYDRAQPAIRRWLAAPQPNLRRAVSEGLRPWTASRRAVFAKQPQLAIDLLGTLKDDPSRYVQESAGNALRDIARKHPDLVLAALRAWLAEDPHAKPRRTIAKFALEHAVKRDPALRELYQ